MVIVFGAGIGAEILISREYELEIGFFIDNDPRKQKKLFWGYDVEAPVAVQNLKYDYIVLASEKYEQEMRKQLLSYGVEKEKIVCAWELEIFNSEEKSTDCIEVESALCNVKIRNRKDYEALHRDYASAEMETVLHNMVLGTKRKRVWYPGRCQVCRKNTNLLIDNLYSEGPTKVNFRERMVCPLCQLNNRQRVMARLVMDEVNSDSLVYLTEQVTPVYATFRKYYKNLIGSEYLAPDTAGGTIDENGIRHEDLMRLSFRDEEIDCIVSNDVLEHVANIEMALSEIYRVLRESGTFYATFPMHFTQEYTKKRAKVNDNGTIEYLLKPIFHGNPVSEDGSLVFYDYGWDFMSLIKEAGFSDAYFIPFYSVPYGNIGANSLFIFIARK